MPPNERQSTLWNGPAGRAWVEVQRSLDDLFRPFEAQLADAAEAAGARQVLDVGCGTGSTTLAIARRLQPGAQCLGLDISAPMIALAERRAVDEGSAARFLVADAQAHDFAADTFDRIVSRFGVMFFDDPDRAFGNLRRASRDGAALHLLAWRSAAENPFMTAAERAAAPLLPAFPHRDPNGPGQFAFADAQRVAGLLARTGWREVDLQPLDVACTLPESEVDRYIHWMGPVGVALQQLEDEATKRRVVEAVRGAYAPFLDGPTLRFTAACWAVRATAG